MLCDLPSPASTQISPLKVFDSSMPLHEDQHYLEKWPHHRPSQNCGANWRESESYIGANSQVQPMDKDTRLCYAEEDGIVPLNAPSICLARRGVRISAADFESRECYVCMGWSNDPDVGKKSQSRALKIGH